MTETAIAIGVPPGWREACLDFIRQENLPWRVVDSPLGRLNIAEEDPPGTCTTERLIPGGRVVCATALEMAALYQAPPAAIGRLMNLLKIKVRECQLGCFK